ncbi:hypothetical protein ZWY2020_053476 [Hordeum vulgare]|nr:hypothetical protein ZWY2020_053476 [Hordeum vulgare]
MRTWIFRPRRRRKSDEDPEHFMPPGFGPVPGLDSPPPVVEAGAPLTAAPFAFDLNVEVEPEDEETDALVGVAPLALDFNVKVDPKDEETGAPIVTAPSIFDLQVKVELENEESFVATLASPPAQATQQSGPPSPPPEARRLLRRFAAAMASRQPGFCAGTWDPASLGFSGEDERGGSSSRRW